MGCLFGKCAFMLRIKLGEIVRNRKKKVTLVIIRFSFVVHRPLHLLAQCIRFAIGHLRCETRTQSGGFVRHKTQSCACGAQSAGLGQQFNHLSNGQHQAIGYKAFAVFYLLHVVANGYIKFGKVLIVCKRFNPISIFCYFHQCDPAGPNKPVHGGDILVDKHQGIHPITGEKNPAAL
jgi:hypothetical protein